MLIAFTSFTTAKGLPKAKNEKEKSFYKYKLVTKNNSSLTEAINHRSFNFFKQHLILKSFLSSHYLQLLLICHKLLILEHSIIFTVYGY